MAVYVSHYPALLLGGFLFFLGFARVTSPYQSRIELKTPLLGRFFDDAILPLGLLLAALPPTIVAAVVFRCCDVRKVARP